jgi:ATP-binding cassette subfamily B protein
MIAAASKTKPAQPPAAATQLPDDDAEEARYKPIDRALVRRLGTLLAPFKWQYALGLALGLAHVTLEMLSPRYMQEIIDRVTAYVAAPAGEAPALTVVSKLVRSIERATGFGLGTGEKAAVAGVILTVAVWAFTLGVSVILQRYLILVMTGAGERVQFDLRRRLFAHLQELSMSYYDKTRLGRIISRLTSDVGALREVNVWGIYHISANLLMMAIAALMLMATDWRLFLSVAWLGPVLFVLNRVYLSKSAVWHQLAREGYTKVSTNLAENITGMRVVTAFNRQEPNLGAFNRLQETNTANNMAVGRINGVYQPLLDLVGFAGKGIILLFGGYLIASGRLGVGRGVGAVVAAYLYVDWFMGPIRQLGTFYTQLMMAMAGAERVFNLLDTPPDVRDQPGAEPLPRVEGRVRFEHVTFGYDPGRPVLHDVDFEAQPGQMVALVGATGSGKSSIVSLVARFYQPQQGRVLVDGQDIRFVTGDSLHRQTGLVLQTNYLFTGTVMENIRYAKPGATEADVIAAAKAIGSHEAIASLSDGYNSEVGERGASMSLGQRQLICFTRAFLADPRIFMLDEATSAVDTATEQLVQRSLERLLAGRTTFVVAHRLSTIMRADCILVIDAGRIVERGTHGELLALGGKYAHLYEQFAQHGA